MKIADIRKLSENDIQKELLASRKELLSLRMQTAAGQDSSPHMKQVARKRIARIKTVMNEKRK